MEVNGKVQSGGGKKGASIWAVVIRERSLISGGSQVLPLVKK